MHVLQQGAETTASLHSLVRSVLNSGSLLVDRNTLPVRSPQDAGLRENTHTSAKGTYTSEQSPSYECLISEGRGQPKFTHKLNEGCLTCSASTDARNGRRGKGVCVYVYSVVCVCVCLKVWIKHLTKLLRSCFPRTYTNTLSCLSYFCILTACCNRCTQ